MKTINNEVIYQIYPLTFNYAPGSKTDPYKGSYGNLKGITAMVDYVASLNIDAIWITPFYPWGATGFGYDITDYYGIDPMYGNLDDFKELCDVYHSKGIRVIIDQVYNHCAESHPWFQKSIDGVLPYKDYFIWVDAKGFDEDGNPILPNNWEAIWNSHGKSVWEWNEKRKQFYMHSFDYSMPNLNLNNSVVQDEILKIAKHWFDLGADGFRLDAATHYAPDPLFRDNPVYKSRKNKGKQNRLYDVNTKGGEDFLNRLKELCCSYETPKTLLAEYWYNKSKRNVKRIRKLFDDSACDAFFTGALNGDIHDFKRCVKDDLNVIPYAKKINWAFSNHDLERVASRMFKDNQTLNKKKMVMHLLLSLPGSVCIYQGEELGLSNPKDFEKCKHPECDPRDIWRNFGMPWDAGRAGFAMSDAMDDVVRNMALQPDDEQFKLAVSNQDFLGSMLNETRRMIKMRKSSLFNDFGNICFIDDIENDDVIAFVRTSSNLKKSVLLVYNFSQSLVNFSYLGENYVLSAESMMQKEL